MTDQTPELIVGTSNAGKGRLRKEAMMWLAAQGEHAVIIDESWAWPRNREGEYEKLLALHAEGRRTSFEISLGDVTIDPDEEAPRG